MDYIKKIKENKLIKRIRTIKWIRRARINLFNNYELKKIKQNYSKLDYYLEKKLNRLPNKGENLLNFLDDIIQESYLESKVNDTKLLKQDMLFCYFAYGFTFNEYVCYKFYENDETYRKNFLSDRDSACICYKYNDIDYLKILADKSETYKYFNNYYKRDAVIIESSNDKEDFLEFIQKHRKFIKKEVLESCGRSIEVFNLDELDVSENTLFQTFASGGKIILEELICQSEYLAKFNRTSVNTLRCITFNTKNGILTPFFFLRTGRNGMVVDNGASGGLIVKINRDNGTIGEAVDEMGFRYNRHPDSYINFLGGKLPDFQQAKSLCTEMSEMLPQVKIIGWDLAHTDNGWIVIEGNSMTEFIGPQSTHLKGIKDEVNNILEEM